MKRIVEYGCIMSHLINHRDHNGCKQFTKLVYFYAQFMIFMVERS